MRSGSGSSTFSRNRVRPSPAHAHWLERICANAPLAVRESLSVVNHEINGDETATWARSDAAHARLLGTNDVTEGIGAFFERRPPHWTGT